MIMKAEVSSKPARSTDKPLSPSRFWTTSTIVSLICWRPWTSVSQPPRTAGWTGWIIWPRAYPAFATGTMTNLRLWPASCACPTSRTSSTSPSVASRLQWSPISPDWNRRGKTAPWPSTAAPCRSRSQYERLRPQCATLRILNCPFEMCRHLSGQILPGAQEQAGSFRLLAYCFLDLPGYYPQAYRYAAGQYFRILPARVSAGA